MTSKSLFLSAAVLSVLTLSACGGVPAANELRFDNDGNGRFSGSAGPDWTAQEIREQAQDICGSGQSVADFSVRALSGGKIFSGRCDGNVIGLANNVQNVPVTRVGASSQAVVAPRASKSGSRGAGETLVQVQMSEASYQNLYGAYANTCDSVAGDACN